MIFCCCFFYYKFIRIKILSSSFIQKLIVNIAQKEILLIFNINNQIKSVKSNINTQIKIINE